MEKLRKKKEEEEEEEQNFSFLVKGLSLSLSQIQSCNNDNKKQITDGRRNSNARIMSLASTAWPKPCYGESFSPDLDSVIHRQRKL